MDRTSRCARPGCGLSSAAVMTYDYASRTVWIDHSGSDPDPTAMWGLCASHADNLRVPVGWARDDQQLTNPFGAFRAQRSSFL